MAWASQTASPHLPNVGCRERICMSASVPWSVNAVEPEAWAAAREAARRSGMSVGEWLEAAIRENAEDTRVRRGRRRAAPPPDDRLEDIAEQLEELIGLAPDLAQTSQQSARVNEGIHRSLNALNERIESLVAGVRTEPKVPVQLQTAIERLDRRLAALLTVEPVPAQTPPEVERKLADIAHNVDTIKGRMERELEALASERAVAPPSPEVEHKLADIARSIDTIKGRMEQELQALASERASAASSPEVERKLADIVSNLETMNKRLEETERAAAATPASIAELDAAVAEITIHQSALEGSEPSPDLQRRFAAIHASLEQSRRESQLSELEQQFRTMIDEVHALRRDSMPTEGVESLRSEIAELSHKLTDLAPRRSLEALERAVDALAQRIDHTGIAGNDNLAQIVDALKLIRQALSEVQPAESFAAVERDLHSLSNKLDALGSRGVDHLTVSGLQSEASEIREVLANALPSDALKALVEQIELLVSRFEEVATNGDATVRDLVGGLERRMEGIAGRLENAAQSSPNADVLAAIGSRIDALQRAFEHSDGRTNGGLEPLLQSLADKFDHAQARLGNLDIIEHELNALSSGLRDMRGSVTEVAEHAARSAVRELSAGAAAKPAPRLAAPPEVKPAAVARTPIAEPASIPVPPVVATEPRPRATQPAERPAAVEGELPADFPLEPGSGSPRARSVQSAAERVALSEAALGTFAPAKPAATETRATDFIAAARRAAQAANAETARAAEERPAETSPLAFLSNVNPKTTRAVAIGLAGMLVIYGAIRYYDVILPSFFTYSAKTGKVGEITPQAKLTTPAPVAPQAKIAETAPIVPPIAPELKVQARGDERDFGIPPAGMLASQPPPAAPVIDPEETGSTTPPPPAAKLTAAPPAAVFAGAPGELPTDLGPASLRAAALAGDAAAAYEVGARWFEGRGVAPNGEQAQRWFEQAVAKGSIHAAYRLGSMHEKGQGIPKNLNEARRLYLIAAEAGHAKAMHNLAVLHAEGIDGKPDLRAAARWFRLAADRGVRDSQYNLGVMYARGAGVTQNLAESYRWFALAAMQGDTEAGKKRDDVAARLDAQSLVAAKLAVQTWTATPLDATVNDVQIKAEWQQAAEAAPAPRKKPTKN
jgi:localization factor PodJL